MELGNRIVGISGLYDSLVGEEFRIGPIISLATLAVSTAALVLVSMLFVTGHWDSREREVEHPLDLTVPML